jgi:HlyD family secretion protein
MSLNSSRASKRWFGLPKPVVVVAGVLILIALVFVGCQAMKPKEPKDPYRTGAVERGAITKSVSASGALEALVTVEVGSQISGQIRQVLVDFNDNVRKGQVLAVLDPQTYESRVASAAADVTAGQASLRQAEATLANAQADYDRKKTLVDKGFYSPSVLDQAQAAFRSASAGVASARARIAQSQATLRSQRVDLARTTIVSPIDGVVVDRQIEPGQTVAASLQAPVLFRIAQDLSKVQVKISVDEADIGQLREGQMVRFTVDAFPEDNFEGIVTQVRKQPVTEQNVVAYTVMAEADNPQGKLLPGMTANADIIIETRPNVLKVPAAALRWNPDAAAANARTNFGPPGFGPPGGRPQQARQGGGGAGGAAGPGGAGRMNLAEQLDLDAAQKKVWEAAEKEMRGKMMQAFASGGGDRQAMRAAIRKNMEEAIAKLEPTLKPAQKAKLAELRAAMAQMGGGRRGGGMTAGTVYVLKAGKPVATPVRVGATDGSFTEVVGSLKPGDQLVTGGGPKPKVQARAPFGGPPGGGGGQRRN